jgi:hypothetical protein
MIMTQADWILFAKLIMADFLFSIFVSGLGNPFEGARERLATLGWGRSRKNGK